MPVESVMPSNHPIYTILCLKFLSSHFLLNSLQLLFYPHYSTKTHFINVTKDLQIAKSSQPYHIKTLKRIQHSIIFSFSEENFHTASRALGFSSFTHGSFWASSISSISLPSPPDVAAPQTSVIAPCCPCPLSGGSSWSLMALKNHMKDPKDFQIYRSRFM